MRIPQTRRDGEDDGRGYRASIALLTWAPLALTAGVVVFLLQHHQLAFDFRREYWVAASRILHGGNPYTWTRAQIYQETAFAYPATAGLLLTPAALAPSWIGAVVMTAVCMACIPGTLWALGVTDRRLYGLTMMWAPVVAGWQSANLTLPLVFVLALVWVQRDRPVICGLLAALMLSLKPFLWPVGLWLLATRRYRAAAWCLVGTVAASLISWSVVGLPRLGDYLSLAGRVTDTLYRSSYGVMGLAAHAGASRGVGEVLLVSLSVALVAGALRAGALRAGALRAGASSERAALTICVVLALVASPLVDTHYLAFLIVPLAIARPRLEVGWLLPLTLWVCPESATSGWQTLMAWLVIAVVAARLIGPPDRWSRPAVAVES